MPGRQNDRRNNFDNRNQPRGGGRRYGGYGNNRPQPRRGFLGFFGS